MLTGQQGWATNGGIAAGMHVVVASLDRELGSRGQAAFVVPPGKPASRGRTRVRRHGIRARPTPRTSPRRCRVPGFVPAPGGRAKLEGEDGAAARGRPRGPRERCPPSRSRARRSAPRPWANPRRLRVHAGLRPCEREQFGGGARDQAVAFALAEHQDGRSTPRACSVWRASWRTGTGQRFEVAEGSMSSQGRRGRGPPSARSDPGAASAAHARVPGRADAPRRQELHDLRGHLGDRAAGRRPRHLGRRCVRGRSVVRGARSGAAGARASRRRGSVSNCVFSWTTWMGYAGRSRCAVDRNVERGRTYVTFSPP